MRDVRSTPKPHRICTTHLQTDTFRQVQNETYLSAHAAILFHMAPALNAASVLQRLFGQRAYWKRETLHANKDLPLLPRLKTSVLRLCTSIHLMSTVQSEHFLRRTRWSLDVAHIHRRRGFT